MNKYQEAIDIIARYENDTRFNLRRYYPESTISDCLSILSELIDKEEKYKWHDLRKDPNDLPIENGLYMVKVDTKIDPYRAPYRVFKYEPSTYGCGLDNPVQNLWKMENDDYCYNNFVVAWKHIEKYK